MEKVRHIGMLHVTLQEYEQVLGDVCYVTIGMAHLQFHDYILTINSTMEGARENCRKIRVSWALR